MLDEMGLAIESITDRDLLFADIRQESRSTMVLRVSNGTLEDFSQAERAGSSSRMEILVELAKEGGVYCPPLRERDL